MEDDDRFKHLTSDPKFKVLKRKERKVQIDDRFKSMFTDKKFTSSADNLKRFYDVKAVANKFSRKKEVDEEDDEGEEKEGVEDDAEDERSNEEKASGLEDTEEDESLSESSDESDSEFEFEEVDGNKIQFDWQPLDHDAETTEIASHRLAIQNLDWDKIDVRDLFTLIKSIRMPLNVRIYISEFGKERLAKEEFEGPQELVEMPKEDEEEEEYRDLQEKMKAIKNVGPKTYKVNEYEDADEIADLKNEELRERVRRYQLNRMKYYYAIAEFDSVESAELVYKELDGLEYEGSSIELDLRFVPDDTEFDCEDIKAECDQVPDLSSYKAPLFINSALQQTTVNFTWDQTDVKRQQQMQRAFTKQELERDDLDAYIGSASESGEDEDEGDSDDDEVRKNKYKELLRNLDVEEGNKTIVDVDVEWGDDDDDGDAHDQDDDEENSQDSDAEDLGNDDISGDEHDDEDYDEGGEDGEDVEQNEYDDVPIKKVTRKDRRGKGRGDRSVTATAGNDRDELDLLMVDSKIKRSDEDFQFNPDDHRFKAVYESPSYNIDPSHPNFKRNKAFDLMAEKKRKKRLKIDN